MKTCEPLDAGQGTPAAVLAAPPGDRSLLEQAIQHAGAMYWLDWESGKVLFANLAACSHFGLTAQQLAGMPLEAVAVGVDLAMLREAAEAAGRAHSTRELEARHRCADASLRDV